jgi:hypothetical protein
MGQMGQMGRMGKMGLVGLGARAFTTGSAKASAERRRSDANAD